MTSTQPTTASNPRLLQLVFQRAAARRALTDIDGWVANPIFVEAVSECDRQIAHYCEYRGWTREQFYSNWILHLRNKPIKE